MGNKVIHISDELHARIRDHCAGSGISQSEWVDKVLWAEFAKIDKVPVGRKSMPRTVEVNRDGTNPWESEPFWKRGKDRGEQQRDGLERDSSVIEDDLGGDGEGAYSTESEVRGARKDGIEREGSHTAPSLEALPETGGQPPGQQGEPSGP